MVVSASITSQGLKFCSFIQGLGSSELPLTTFQPLRGIFMFGASDDPGLGAKKTMFRSTLSGVMVTLGTPTGFLRARTQVFKGVPRTFILMVERI